MQGWAGRSSPDDPLFGVARSIKVTGLMYELEKETLMNLRKDLGRRLNYVDVPADIYVDVMTIIDGYIGRV